tara:strand:- start:8739 stop:10025 length:1287 start_codon:yes stop_codon:yes gene_type:complete
LPKTFLLVGLISLNYKAAPIEIRERFHFEDSEKLVFNNLLKKNVGVEGLMIISTCNRTEIYFEFENHFGQEKKFLHNVIKELVEFKKYRDSLSPFLINYTSSLQVANHLFRLVSGLESMIIGEFQIVEQLKNAYYYATRRKMLGPILKRMIQKALETGKYIRTNTGIDKGAVSVSYAAVEQITKKYDLKNSKFLCVGLGETSKLSVKHLHQKNIKKIKISNRSKEKGIKFCEDLGYEFVDFNDFKNEIHNSDVVFFSTSSNKKLLSKKDLAEIMNNRDKSLLIVDLSVPRNIPSNIKIKNLEIVNIDNLKDAVNENYKRRKKEIIKAEEYIDDFLIEFDDWTNSRTLRPSILSIKKEIREVFVNETLNKIDHYKCNCDDIEDSNLINEKLNKIYNKFTNSLVKKIRKASNNGKDEKAIKVINQIFLNE